MYNFPAGPTEGQEFVPPVGGQTYVFHSPRWLVKGIPPAAGSGGGSGSGIGEAPEDGKQYTRKSADWSTPITQSSVANLVADLAAKAPIGSAVPVGACVSFPATAAPAGWLKRNGVLLSRTTYAALWAFAQASGNLAASDAAWTGNEGQFSPGDGSSTFRIPDARGEFDRNWDDGRGADAGRTIGSRQIANLENHSHTFSGSLMGTHNHTASSGINSADHTHSFSDSSSATGTGSANHAHNIITTLGASSGGGGIATGTVTVTEDGRIYTDSVGAAHTHTVAVSGTTGANSVDHTHVITNVAITAGTPAGSNSSYGTGIDTRPRNVAMLACIKY